MILIFLVNKFNFFFTRGGSFKGKRSGVVTIFDDKGLLFNFLIFDGFSLNLLVSDDAFNFDLLFFEVLLNAFDGLS